MTVRFAQLVAPAQAGKTTFLARSAVEAASRGETVAVVLVNQHNAESFARACIEQVEANGALTSDYNYMSGDLNITRSENFCEHCERGDVTSGKIRFVTRDLYSRRIGVGGDHVSKLYVDNVEFLANDRQPLEDTLLDTVYEFVRPDGDLDVVVTSRERALDLGGTLNF